MNKNKKIALVSAVIVLFLIAYLQLSKDEEKTSYHRESLPVNTFTIHIQDSYKAVRTFVGVVNPRQLSSIGFELGGKIEKIYVEEGDYIPEGKLIAKLDTLLLNAQREEARAQLEGRQAVYNLAQSSFKRIEEAAQSDAISQQDFDESHERLNEAKAHLEVAEAQLNKITISLKKAFLYAPFSGTIIKKNVSSGMTVDAGTPIVTIQEDTIDQVKVGVTTDIAETLTQGDSLTLTINNKPVKAVIDSILPIQESQTRTIPIILTPKVKVRPGDLVTLDHPIEIKKKGAFVPLTAMTETIRGLWAVYAIKEENDAKIAELRLVEPIYQADDKVFVEGNIQSGEKIVKDGIHRLVSGQLLKVE